MAFDRKAYYKSDKKKELDRIYYQEYKERHLSNSRKLRILYKQWFNDYKSTLSCMKCGFTGHGVAIDFHHDNDDKTDTVATLAGTTSSKKRVLEEISKCTVLCANCHRILHAEMRNSK